MIVTECTRWRLAVLRLRRELIEAFEAIPGVLPFMDWLEDRLKRFT